jgi:hypothetical protein
LFHNSQSAVASRSSGVKKNLEAASLADSRCKHKANTAVVDADKKAVLRTAPHTTTHLAQHDEPHRVGGQNGVEHDALFAAQTDCGLLGAVVLCSHKANTAVVAADKKAVVRTAPRKTVDLPDCGLLFPSSYYRPGRNAVGDVAAAVSTHGRKADGERVVAVFVVGGSNVDDDDSP